MRVLIGYDGSQCAEDAITNLQHAGLPADGTEALVLAVADVYPRPAPSDPVSEVPPAAAVILRDIARARAAVKDAVNSARAAAERAAARVRELFPRWSVLSEARADTPHWALVAKATEWRADLVVVGSRGRSALARVLLGSVSQQVLHNAPCSVRISRCPATEAAVREPHVRLILGIDGSVDSATAASAVAARHWPTGSEVLVVGVLDARVLLNYARFDSPTQPPSGSVTAGASSELEASSIRVCDELRRSGIAATSSVLIGDAKKLLVEEAERIGANCIFVGAKGHARLERVLLGSVSATVAARAHCSVEVVRHG